MWIEALNLASVPASLELRRVKNIYYPPDIREGPVAFLGLGADAAMVTTVSKQPSIAQVSLPPPKVSKGPSKAGDQG